MSSDSEPNMTDLLISTLPLWLPDQTKLWKVPTLCFTKKSKLLEFLFENARWWPFIQWCYLAVLVWMLNYRYNFKKYTQKYKERKYLCIILRFSTSKTLMGTDDETKVYGDTAYTLHRIRYEIAQRPIVTSVSKCEFWISDNSLID